MPSIHFPILLISLFVFGLFGSSIAQNETISNVTTVAPVNTTVNITTMLTTMVNITTEPPRPITTQNASTQQPPTVTTANATTRTTTRKPNRKFDGFSFVGGIVLTLGLTALTYLVVVYLRRSNRLPYSNIH